MISLKDLKWFTKLFNPARLKVFSPTDLFDAFYNLIKSKPEPLDDGVIELLGAGLNDEKKDLACFVLRLYFFTVFKDGKHSIDLRRKNFTYDDKWKFKCSSFGYRFEGNFITKMRELYDIFYTGDSTDLEKPMTEIGLIADHWKDEDKKKIINLFVEHFSAVDLTAANFKTSHLVKSFTKIFIHLASKRVRLKVDFAMLGIALTSLYSTLDSLNSDVSVVECYEVAKELAESNRV